MLYCRLSVTLSMGTTAAGCKQIYVSWNNWGIKLHKKAKSSVKSIKKFWNFVCSTLNFSASSVTQPHFKRIGWNVSLLCCKAEPWIPCNCCNLWSLLVVSCNAHICNGWCAKYCHQDSTSLSEFRSSFVNDFWRSRKDFWPPSTVATKKFIVQYGFKILKFNHLDKIMMHCHPGGLMRTFVIPFLIWWKGTNATTHDWRWGVTLNILQFLLSKLWNVSRCLRRFVKNC